MVQKTWLVRATGNVTKIDHKVTQPPTTVTNFTGEVFKQTENTQSRVVRTNGVLVRELTSPTRFARGRSRFVRKRKREREREQD